MIEIREVSVRRDERGESFTVGLPFDRVADSHVATLKQGHVRGNHFHRQGRELLVIVYLDRWTLLGDGGEGTAIETRSFEGTGAIQIDIPPGIAHAVRNDGASDLWLFVLRDAPPPDTYPRRLVQG